MKKKLTATLFLATALCACALIPSLDTVPARASSVKRTAVEDNFDSDVLGGDWAADAGVEQKTVYSCMRLKDMNIWQPAIILQAYEVKKEKPCVISFDLSVTKLSGWLGFFVGARSTAVPFYDAASMWMMSKDSVGHWRNDGSALVEQTGESLSASPIGEAAGGNVMTVRYALTYTDENEQGTFFDVNFSYGPKGGETKAEKTYSKVAAQTYVGFASMANLGADIMNFKVEEKDDEGEYKEVFFDDFSSGSVVYPGSSNPDANWRVTHTYQKENVFVGALKRVVFDDVTEGKLQYDTPIETDKRCEKQFEMSFSLYPEQLNDNAYFGVGFGLTGAESYADSVNMIAFRKNGEGASLVKVINGVEVAAADKRYTLASLGKGNVDGAKITLAGYCDGSLTVSVGDGTGVRFEDMVFDGYFALAASKKYDKQTTGNQLAVDDFRLDIFEYKSADSGDMAINFEGIKEFEQFGATYYEHYYNRGEWYLSGSGVSLAPYRSNMDNDYLQMVNATGNVAFGPKNRVYSDFIVRFNVMMLSSGADTPADTAVGLAFGKRSRDTVNSDASCVWFSYNGSSTSIGGLNVRTEDGSASVPCSINLWNDTSTIYNVMMIVSDRTVEVYLKRSTDDISAFGILRAKFTDVNTYGYLALTCNTLDGKKGNCKLTDFSITNLQR